MPAATWSPAASQPPTKCARNAVPGAVGLFADIDSAIGLAFLTRFPRKSPTGLSRPGAWPPKQLRDAVCDFAGDSRRANPSTADLYSRARARGHDHPQATRILARAWLNILWHCWHDRVPYHPTRHRGLQRLLEQDRSTAA
ncbi:MAG TPA: hypothetical protein VF288_09370 [Mycobacteriales bacterium]